MSVQPPPGQILGHPKGLFLLFSLEMWERFSYYGMRALLVLTLVAATGSADPGFGFSDAEALRLYSYFTAIVWFTPIFGGWLADRFLGQRRAVFIGALVMACGQFIAGSSVPGNLSMFEIGLTVLVLGNGMFKANISTMVGMLYQPGDARRDGAFTIFYVGINLGGLIGPLICSTFGENPSFGWRYGYYAAGVGLTLSAVLQALFARRSLGELGLRPSKQVESEAKGASKAPLTREEMQRIQVILMLFVFCVLFWAAFEQQGGLLNLFAANKTDRMINGWEMPAGWLQSAESLFIILLGPVFAIIWTGLGRRGRNPSSPVKMALGLIFSACGFVTMLGASLQTTADGKVSMAWLLIAYLFQTMAELCISPVGLSMTTKLAPARFASAVMGIWFLTNFFGNFLAGQIGALADQMGDTAIFAGFAITLCLFAGVLWLLSPRLVRWMHGAEEVDA